MADPAWFFSTIAQAIAAAIGFVLAFTATIYTVRKNRIRQKLGRFLDSIDVTYRDFDEPLLSITEDLREKGTFSAPFAGLTIAFSDNPDIDGWAEDEDSTVGVLWANLLKIHGSLNSASSASNSGDIPSSFESLTEYLKNAKRITEDEEITMEIYEEITGEIADDDYRTTPIFDFAQATEDLLRRRSGKQPHTANTIQGIDDLLTELEIDVSSIERRHTPNRIAFEDKPPRDLFENAVSLFIIGVLIPMAFLLTPPVRLAQLTDYHTEVVFILQILLLLVVAQKSIELFRALWGLVEIKEL